MATTKSKTKAPVVKVTLATFDDSSTRPVYRAVRESVKLADFKAVGHKDYQPAGMTPLLDAMVEFIEHMRKLRDPGEVQIGLLLDESGSMGGNRDTVIESVNKFVGGLRDVKKVDRKTAGKGFLVVATDGYENASKQHSHEDVVKLVKKCEKDGWVMIFLGAGIDGWSQGRSVGVSGQSAFSQVVSTKNSEMGTRAAWNHVTSGGVGYLAENEAYLSQAAGQSSRSVTEDGSVTLSNIGATTGAQSGTLDEVLAKIKGDSSE